MYNPCHECFIRYNKVYASECDNACRYARDIKDADDIIEYLLDKLEEEHMGMRAVAVKEIADQFGIEL
jgi:hypothetical protein